MTYARTARQKATDFAESRQLEELVSSYMGPYQITHFTSPDKLDIWLPGGLYVEVKEKKQKIGSRWQLPASEEDSFIIDELSIRKGLLEYPNAYYVLRDTPCDRWFLASIAELAMCDRVRCVRAGENGHEKGKHVLDLAQFTELGLADVLPAIMDDQVNLRWKTSGCIVANGASYV